MFPEVCLSHRICFSLVNQVQLYAQHKPSAQPPAGKSRAKPSTMSETHVSTAGTIHLFTNLHLQDRRLNGELDNSALKVTPNSAQH